MFCFSEISEVFYLCGGNSFPDLHLYISNSNDSVFSFSAIKNVGCLIFTQGGFRFIVHQMIALTKLLMRSVYHI